MEITFETKSVQINGNAYYILLQADDTNPSALVALSNVLILSPSLSNIASNLVQLVRNNTHIILNELVETLANIGVQNPNSVNTNINQLLQILPQLHNGLAVNPEFNGSFEDSVEILIFRLFNVGIVHGWMIDGQSDPIAYEHVSKYSYQEAQNVLIQSYDLKKTTSEQLDAHSRQIVEDSNYIKSFLARSASQFTEYGLHHLKEILVEKSFAVLYRNDHFFTLYKNNGELYVLVNDLKHKYNNEVVWKSLKSVNGAQDTFTTGNFIPITFDPNSNAYANTASIVTPVATMGNVASNPFNDPNGAGSKSHLNRTVTTNTEHQVEDDEELARMLQEEEDRAAAGRLQGIAMAQARRDDREAKANKRKSFFSSNDTNDKPKEKGKRKRDKLKKNCIVM